MAPSPFAVKLSVGAVGAVEAVGGGGALSQEVVLLVVTLALTRGAVPATAQLETLTWRGLELSDSVAGTGIAARVRALARPSKTTPRPWVYEAGAREGLEI